MRATFFGVIAALVTGVATAGENWPEFRGPRGDGTTVATKLPLTWSEKEHVVWKTPIPGRGWSSPVIWEKQIWLTTATEDGKQQSAIAVDADTGAVLHNLLVFKNADPAFCHPTNSYASPTPAIEAGRCYVHFGTYGTAAIDTKSGEILWTRRDFECDHFRGPASSPIIHEDLLIVAYDGFDVQYMVALDKHTGKTAWRKPRDINYGTDNGDRKKSYSTASVFEVDGKPLLISPSATETIAYQPKTGEEVWRVRHGGMNAACRPVQYKNLVFITAGDGPDSLIAVDPRGSGDISKENIKWRSAQTVPKRSSLVVVDGIAFMTTDNGVVTARSADDGEIYWQKRVGGDFWASPLAGAGRLYFSSKSGKTVVIAAKKEFEQLAENQLKDGFNASPSVIDNDLILRTATHLYRIGE